MAGVSGGPDSIALLHLLNRLREDLGFGLYAGHLNHMFRGEEADADAGLVENLAGEWQIPLINQKINVPEYIRQHRLSPEQGAREVRYRFFEEAAAGVGAGKVALGHHADDQAETVLLNLIRGAGITGLSGIPPVRQGLYIRPLLKLRRSQIEQYCRTFGLPYRVDSSNLQPVYLRNRIRLELIPLLENKYNPAMVDSLNRLAEIARDEDGYLEAVSLNVFEKVVKSCETGKIIISLEKLAPYPIALKRRVIRIACRRLAGYDALPSFEQLGKALEIIGDKTGQGKVEWPAGVVLVKRYGFLEMIKNRVVPQVPFYQYVLEVPGKTPVPETGACIEAVVLDASRVGDPRRFRRDETVLDLEKLTGTLTVRRRKQGDVFIPLGMKGKIKLKKFFIDRKVPGEEREQIPIVTCGNDIVWVAGFQPGDPWKVTDQTRTCLYLKLLPGNK